MYDMLSAFLKMKELVTQYLDKSSNGLLEYKLSVDEWEAVEGLVSALKVWLSIL